MTREELDKICINKPDETLYCEIQHEWDSIAKPIDGMGDCERLICKIGAILGNKDFSVERKAHIIMCADNGVICEGVSQSDSSVTEQVAALMGKRVSSVCQLMKGIYSLSESAVDSTGNIVAFVVDVGMNSDTPAGVINRKVTRGTKNIRLEAAMSEEECLKAISAGIEMVKTCSDKGITLISTGEMGIGNTTTSAALLCALTGESVEKIAGRGAGLDDESFTVKKKVIEEALLLHKTAAADDFELLRRLGGLDIAGLAGVFIGGAIYHIPVIIDGVISATAALVADRIVNLTADYCIASHSGRERGTLLALNKLGLKPLLLGDMALGEGCGAVMMFPLIDMIVHYYREGLRFSTTTIDEYERYQ